jgi:hypothetical protein
MDEYGVPSYAEVYIDGAKPINMDVVNRHLKLITASYVEHMRHGADRGCHTYLFKPIYETINTKTKKTVGSKFISN